MFSMLFHVFLLAIGIFVIAHLLPGIKVKSFGTSVVVAVVYAILDKLLFNVLVLLSLPFVILSFGMFLLVINAFLLWMTHKLVDGFELTGGVVTLFLASLSISALSLFLL